MDPEKVKTTATTTLTTTTTTVSTSSVKSSTKIQSRHQEHNYTNTSKTGETYHESSVSKTTTTATTMTTASTSSSSSSTTVVASPSDSTTESQRASYSGTRSSGGIGSGAGGGGGFLSTSQSVQPTSTLSGDRHSYEVRSRVIKKDVFNRIRRSEEELQKAAEMVRGGMTFQTASDTFKIPISTIRFYMARRGILPQRRRGRGSTGVRDDDLIHPPFEIVHYRLPDIDRPF